MASSSMVSRGHKSRISLQKRKVEILKSIINSKSVKRSMILMDALIHISKLKLQIEAITKEIEHLTNNIVIIEHLNNNLLEEVKVEKLEGSKLLIRAGTWKKRQDLLVSILEEFENLKINVCQVRVKTCKYFFCLVAIVEAPHDEIMDVNVLMQAIHNVIDN